MIVCISLTLIFNVIVYLINASIYSVVVDRVVYDFLIHKVSKRIVRKHRLFHHHMTDITDELCAIHRYDLLTRVESAVELIKLGLNLRRLHVILLLWIGIVFNWNFLVTHLVR